MAADRTTAFRYVHTQIPTGSIIVLEFPSITNCFLPECYCKWGPRHSWYPGPETIRMVEPGRYLYP
eukprot:1357758-Rhodomonas_salina.1